MNFIFSAENVRTTILFVAIIGGFTWLKSEMKFLRYDLEKMIDEKFSAQDKKFDEKFAQYDNKFDKLDKRLDEFDKRLGELDKKFGELDEKLDKRFSDFHTLLKENDFAHLERTIKALTFTLEKNGILKVEDKSYVDSQLEN